MLDELTPVVNESGGGQLFSFNVTIWLSRTTSKREPMSKMIHKLVTKATTTNKHYHRIPTILHLSRSLIQTLAHG